ncbi:aspartate/glutamate racemase family protein [Pseudotabrizicola sp. 4114]|uniref:aspartate/glutamate racemase family protein n=1 Tax=Pseudotabrizicola sp. 4114 TaxID=2817731 RepID=UPI0028614249|nr:Asp/Glu/hydantoin racemase [Pseudorhodobacter sp. 4114]
MRIFWQSFVDESASAPYMERLAKVLNEIAMPGTTVDVFGLSPPDRAFSRLSELRCAVLAIDNAIAAAEAGYDAVVMGHFQDPGLYDMKSAVTIPVIGAGEATMHFAAQLGREIGLVSLDELYRSYHLEQAALYGLGDRVVHVAGMNGEPSDFSEAFAGNLQAKARMLGAFRAAAQPLVDKGADVIVAAGILPALLVGSEHGMTIGPAPVVNAAAVTLFSAEMQVRLARLNGTGICRGQHCNLSPAQAIHDFRDLIANGRKSTLKLTSA